MSRDVPYLPEAGRPTIITLSALTVSTAAHAVFLAQGTTPPLWLIGVTLALIVIVCAAIPSMNRRARTTDRVSRAVARSAVAAAIVIPLLLLASPPVGDASPWLPLAGVATQSMILLAVSVMATLRRGGPARRRG